MRNSRVVLAGLLLLLASALLALAAIRPALSVPIAAGAGAMIIVAVVALLSDPLRNPRPV